MTRAQDRIILIGFMGTGKSTVGRLLARHLGYAFLDTDRMVEKKTGMKVATVVRRKGWPRFRALETQALRRALKKKAVVVATGGGIILSATNRRLMSRHGTVVHLSARPATILKRIRRCKTRPLLNIQHPRREILRLLKKRARFYRQADQRIVTDGKSPRQVAGAILSYVGRS